MTLPSGVSLLTVYPSVFVPKEDSLVDPGLITHLPNFKVSQSKEQIASVIRIDDPNAPVERTFNFNGTQWVTSRSPEVTPVFSVDLYFRVINSTDQTNQNGFLFSTLFYPNATYPYLGNGIKITGKNIRGVSGTAVTNALAVTGPVGTWQRFTCQWRDNRLYIYLDGSLVADVYNFLRINTATPPYDFVTVGASTLDRSEGFRGDIAQVRFFYGDIPVEDILAYDNTPLQVREDGVNCLRMDEQSSVSKPLLIDHTKWVVGQPPPPEFTLYGTSLENQIVSDVDPWGKIVPHWRAFPDAITGPGGGFGISVPASSDETYRMSVFIRRNVIAGSGDGKTYFGCQTSAGKLLNSLNLADNTNPFFGSMFTDTTEWLLWVGYCRRANSPAGIFIGEGGVYNMEGDLVLSGAEFVLPAGITSLTLRAFLSDGTNSSSRQSYLYPRIDVVDGSEPSISELLAGYDSAIYESVKACNNQPVPLSMNDSIKSEFSEIGITRGLLGYFPFYGDIEDWYQSKLVAVNNELNFTFTDDQTPFDGAAFTGEDGRKFISIDFDRSQFVNGSGKDFTILCFVKQNTVQCRGILFELHDSTTTQSVVSVVGKSGQIDATYHGVGAGEVAKYRSVAGPASNLTWAMYAVTYSDTDKTLKIYYARHDTKTGGTPSYPAADSYDVATNINLAPFDTIKIGHGFPVINSYTNQGLNAILSNFKVFGVALTREEITVEWKRANSISSVGNGFLTTHGTFNEL